MKKSTPERERGGGDGEKEKRRGGMSNVGEGSGSMGKEKTGRRKQKVICNPALEGEPPSGGPGDCFCYCCLAFSPGLFIVIVLSPH